MYVANLYKIRAKKSNGDVDSGLPRPLPTEITSSLLYDGKTANYS
jgi:hypothetical protein